MTGFEPRISGLGFELVLMTLAVSKNSSNTMMQSMDSNTTDSI